MAAAYFTRIKILLGDPPLLLQLDVAQAVL